MKNRIVETIEINRNENQVKLSQSELALIISDLSNYVEDYDVSPSINVGDKTTIVALIFTSKRDLDELKDDVENFIRVFEKMLHFTTTMYHYLPLPKSITANIDKDNKARLG